jgi:hypothetical protein
MRPQVSFYCSAVFGSPPKDLNFLKTNLHTNDPTLPFICFARESQILDAKKAG